MRFLNGLYNNTAVYRLIARLAEKKHTRILLAKRIALNYKKITTTIVTMVDVRYLKDVLFIVKLKKNPKSIKWFTFIVIKYVVGKLGLHFQRQTCIKINRFIVSFFSVFWYYCIYKPCLVHNYQTIFLAKNLLRSDSESVDFSGNADRLWSDCRETARYDRRSDNRDNNVPDGPWQVGDDKRQYYGGYLSPAIAARPVMYPTRVCTCAFRWFFIIGTGVRARILCFARRVCSSSCARVRSAGPIWAIIIII